jgi:hypothetical protein
MYFLPPSIAAYFKLIKSYKFHRSQGFNLGQIERAVHRTVMSPVIAFLFIVNVAG